MRTMKQILRNEERRVREQEMLCHMGQNTQTLIHTADELRQAMQMNQELQRQHEFAVNMQNTMNVPF